MAAHLVCHGHEATLAPGLHRARTTLPHLEVRVLLDRELWCLVHLSSTRTTHGHGGSVDGIRSDSRLSGVETGDSLLLHSLVLHDHTGGEGGKLLGLDGLSDLLVLLLWMRDVILHI